MDKKIIKGLIDEKLEVIQDQFSVIKAYEGKIPVIELDLLMVSIRDLYELVLNLQSENTGGVMLKQEPKPVEKPAEEIPPVIEPVEPVRFSSGIISMEPVFKEEPIEEPPLVDEIEAVLPELPVDSFEPPAYEPPQPEPQAPTSPAPETKADQDQPGEKYQRITFDLFSEGSGTTLADRLREGQEKRVADKLQENMIVDLRTTIGINDKFLFINELFEGNMRIYDEAIQKLNAGTTMAQADMMLLDLKIVYNWDSDSPTVKKFVELVRRKF